MAQKNPQYPPSSTNPFPLTQLPPTGQYPPGGPPPVYDAYNQPPPLMSSPVTYQPTGQQFTNSSVTVQPATGAIRWMPIPQNVTNCPPGLEYLSMIDQILVHQQVEVFELLFGVEGANKYRVKNNLGQDVYFAAEDSDFCTRNCLGKLRPFDMNIIDNTGREVIRLSRPYNCDTCCYPCCLQKLEVQAPVGQVIGYVVQEWSLFPSFTIQNANEEPMLRISGPLCGGCNCGDIDFDVLALDGVTKVGKIQKQWTGFIQEMYTDADNFGITFPMDLDVRMKAVMLGACFLIDFIYFEENQQNNN